MTVISANAAVVPRLASPRACWVKIGPVSERAALRVPFDETIVVTPWDPAAGAPSGPAMLAAGRNISAGGISFSHVGLLPYRHVAASFPSPRHDEEGRLIVETLVVRLIWCRFTRRGVYHSGGRFEGTLSEAFGRPLAVLLEGTTASR